jgi:hypothetical protein
MKNKSQRWLAWLAGALVAFGCGASAVQAHGGEDHGDEKPAVAQTNANVTVRVARAGDYEITLKHAALKPDKATAARVFVTRFASNEPGTDAQVILLITGATPLEVTASATETPGVYEAKLPPLPAGDVTLSVKISVGGTPSTASFGRVTVAPPAVAMPENATLWARTVLLASGVLAVLGILSAALFLGRRLYYRRQFTKDEEVAAV